MTNLTIGERVTTANGDDLPPGSCITDSHNDWWRTESGLWHTVGNTYSHRLADIVGYGTWTVKKVGWHPPLTETIEQFKQRFNTVAYGAAHSNGSTYLERTIPLLRQMGLPVDDGGEIGPNMWLYWADRRIRERLTTDHRLVIGTPNTPQVYGLFDGRGGHIEGMLRNRPLMLRIKGVEGTDLYTRPPGEDDERLIREFKSQAWTIGYRTKTDNGWCSAFESAMAMCGIDASSEIPELITVAASVVAHGTSITYAEAQALPDGAIVMYPPNGEFNPAHESWNWCVRDRSSRYHTRHLFGRNSGQFTTGRQRLIWDGTGEMVIPIEHRDVLEFMPVGSRFRERTSPSNGYVKCADGSIRAGTDPARSTGHAYDLTAFNLGSAGFLTWELVRIGMDEPVVTPRGSVVGQVVGSHDAMRAAPVGAQVQTRQGRIAPYTKRENGRWSRDGVGEHSEEVFHQVETHWTWAAYPTVIEVGMVATAALMVAAPVGSVVNNGGPGTGYTKRESGAWSLTDSTRHPFGPDEEAIASAFGNATANGHQWRFATVGTN